MYALPLSYIPQTGPPSLRTTGLLIVATSNSDRFKVFQRERFRVVPAVYRLWIHTQTTVKVTSRVRFSLCRGTSREPAKFPRAQCGIKEKKKKKKEIEQNQRGFLQSDRQLLLCDHRA